MSSTPSTLPFAPEILHLICKGLGYNKPTLASLARTCRAFENPAVEVLWYRLNSLYPLAKCLPSNVWTEVTGSGSKGTRRLTLRQPFTSADCVRLLRYAEKVQHFTIEYARSPNVDMATCQALHVATLGTKLFPNVRKLSLKCLSDEDMFYFSLIDMFLGPRLTDFEFDYHVGTILPQVSFIPVLCDLYPTLKNVTIRCPEHYLSRTEEITRFLNFISGTFAKWKMMETLKIPYLPYTNLLEVSKLPNLKMLQLFAWKLDPSPPDAQMVPAGGFLSLDYLRVHASSAADCIALMAVMCSSPIRKMEFIFRRGTTLETWRNFFSALQGHCNNGTLQQFTCEMERDIYCYRDDELGEYLDYQAIKPLLSFHNLQSLRVQVPRGVHMADPSATMEMASSWTKIRQLMLEVAPQTSSLKMSKITLGDLHPFATHCPNLEKLGLFLNATSPPAIDGNKPANGISHMVLTELYVADSPASGSNEIAAFLSSLFPCLKVIASKENRRGSTATWLSAQGMIYAFRGVREQERLYVKSQI